MFSEWGQAKLFLTEQFGVVVTKKPEEIREVRDYIAYLLRMWREKNGDSTRWRASLQDPHSGEKVAFTHLDNLFDFLRQETGGHPVKSRNKSDRVRKGEDDRK